MFYGLSKFFKNLLPKQLFYRALLIVAAPIIILQITVSIVFFDSLWIKTNKGMTRALVAEIKTFTEAYDNEKYDKNELKNLFSIYLDLNVKYVQNNSFEKEYNERWFSPIDRTLRRELKSKIGNDQYWFNTTTYKELIILRIKYEKGYFEFLVPKDRVTSSSARMFALWITFPAMLINFHCNYFFKKPNTSNN
tara:strand:+ start:680 stop:1258 length:579 start_codon:yes stop_codon:yes gene_type:complete